MGTDLKENAVGRAAVPDKTAGAGRNYGVDALRIFSMFLVLILHILQKGDLLSGAFNAATGTAWALEIMAYCAVDIYALISGFVGYTDKPKPFRCVKPLRLWVQVFTYSFGITLAAFLVFPQKVTEKQLFSSLVPIASRPYWYFTAYILLLILQPFVNRFLRFESEKQLTRLAAVSVFFLSVFPQFSAHFEVNDPFVTFNGYSFLWLLFLYILGAWIKRIDLVNRMRPAVALVGMLLCGAVTWIVRELVPERFKLRLLVNYTSPTVLFMAVAYLVLFARMRVGRRTAGVIAFFAPASFGVYLLHVHPLVWYRILPRIFLWISKEPVLMAAEVLGCAVVLLALFMLIEKLRLWLFRVLQIDRLVGMIGSKLDASFAGG